MADDLGGSQDSTPSPADASAAMSDVPTDEPPPPASDGGSADEDRRTSFMTAERIEVGTPPRLIDELSVDQLDHFVFHGQAGHFYEISTDNDTYSPDTVLALYDAQRRQLATNDEGELWPGDSYDARLVVRLPADGDYFITVDDPYTPAEFFQQSFRVLFYHLTVREVMPTTPGFSAPGPKLAFSQDAMTSYRYVTVLGEAVPGLNTLSFEGLADTALIARIHPGGGDGNGSTVSNGQVQVVDALRHRLAAIDRAMGSIYFRPPIDSGTHTITFEVPDALGANPFYVMDLVLLAENPVETDETANGKPAAAEHVLWSRITRGRALLLSRLPYGDVDYYAVEARQGQLLGFSCEGESTGSGVRGVHAELVDADDRVLAVKLQEDGEFVIYEVERSGPLYLKLTSLTPAATADSVDPWVRCVMQLI